MRGPAFMVCIFSVLGMFGFNSACRAAPDIVLFLADDLGSTIAGPISHNGAVATPNIDALGAAGMVYTGAYAAPACVQARVMLLTGRWPQRPSVGGITGNSPRMPGSVTTVAEMLKPLGYQTAIVGKWHLGFDDGMHPLDQGFDSFFGFRGYTPDYDGADLDAPLFRDREQIENVGSLTDTLGAEAVRILQQPREAPLFLYVAWNAPHDPLQGTLAQRISEMDANIGRIMAAAKPDTLFVYTADNGRGASKSNLPFRGGKFDIWEGGVRVPLAMRWTGRIAAGKRETLPASLLDLPATFVAAAGGLPTATDGINLLQKIPGGRAVYFKAMSDEPGYAVRRGSWKLLLDYQGVPVALYAITKDKGETQNVAAANPKVVADLTRLLKRYQAELSY